MDRININVCASDINRAVQLVQKKLFNIVMSDDEQGPEDAFRIISNLEEALVDAKRLAEIINADFQAKCESKHAA